MKILWITEFFPSSDTGEIVGGVESRNFFVAKYLKKSGQNLKVISRVNKSSLWQPANFASVPESLLYYFKALFKGLGEDYDLVEGSNSVVYPLAWILGRLKNKPVVYWVPDIFLGFWIQNIGLVGILGEIADRISLFLAPDKFIVISQNVKDKLMQRNFSGDKIVVVNCGVELSEVAQVKDDTKVYDICTVSRLLPYKRVTDLIDAVKKIKDDFPKIKVIILGQGPERNNLTSLISQLGLNRNINLIDYIASHKQVLALIKHSKILVHPSTVEGFGIAIIEAASLGVPYVASDIATIVEITRNGRGGLLFKAKDIDDLSNKIKALLSDSNLYRAKSRRGIELSKQYDWKDIAGLTLRTYENLLTH